MRDASFETYLMLKVSMHSTLDDMMRSEVDDMMQTRVDETVHTRVGLPVMALLQPNLVCH